MISNKFGQSKQTFFFFFSLKKKKRNKKHFKICFFFSMNMEGPDQTKQVLTCFVNCLLGDNLHEKSKPIFWEKIEKISSICHLLNFPRE